MKNRKLLIFLLPVLLIFSSAAGQENNKQKFEKLEWLIGKWTRINSKPGQSGYETWTKVSDLKLEGKGITMKGQQAIFVEHMELSIKDNDIFYIVTVTGEKQPTYFKLTALTKDSFTCENPQHDFPKKITYQRNGEHVKATISGNGQSIDYNFVAAR